ncbi:MAG: Lrp/AsnC family transcriptional regulator [Pseudomonadota bacterium]
MKLDATDQQILNLLQSDASLAVAEIADRVNLSQPPCWRRIKRLEEAGFINARVALLNRRELGLNLVTYIEIKLSANRRAEVSEFEHQIRAFPEVTECYLIAGRADFLLRVVTRDVDAYERFYRDHLSLLPGLEDITSFVAMSEVKYTTELPLAQSFS